MHIPAVTAGTAAARQNFCLEFRSAGHQFFSRRGAGNFFFRTAVAGTEKAHSWCLTTPTGPSSWVAPTSRTTRRRAWRRARRSAYGLKEWTRSPLGLMDCGRTRRRTSTPKGPAPVADERRAGAGPGARVFGNRGLPGREALSLPMGSIAGPGELRWRYRMFRRRTTTATRLRRRRRRGRTTSRQAP